MSETLSKTAIKEAARAFIVQKIRDTTCQELNDFAHGLCVYDLFSFAECFDNEAYRVEKFFCFPEIPEKLKKMAEFSPAAQAIVSAFDDRYELCGPFDNNWQELCLGAALRATADALIPEVILEATPSTAGGTLGGVEWVVEKDRQRVRSELISLATAIENRG